MESRRALITGAHGFIGRNLARHLASAGWDVTGLGHGHWPEEEWRAWGLRTWIPGDVDQGTLARAGPHESVFHCAGGASVRFANENPHEDFRRSVLTTAALLEWIRTLETRASCVLVSSAAVYGDTGSEKASEVRVPRPESIYATHKLMAEDLCRLYARVFSVPCAIVRLFSIYGPGLRKQLLWDACNKLMLGEGTFAGTGREARDWLHVSDAAALLAMTAQRATESCEIVNGGTGEAATVAEVAGVVAEALQAGPPRFTSATRPGDPERLVADPRRAFQGGWRPAVQWREGVLQYCGWFLADQRGRA